MRTAMILLSAMLSTAASAQSAGFYLPNAAPSYGQDEFRASDGTSCRTTMDGTKRLEVGSFASGGSQTGAGSNFGLPSYVANPTQGNVGVYGRFSWSLDAKPTRMDCTKLYDLEIEKKRLELELLKQQVQVAKQGMREADKQLGDLKKQRTRQKTASSAPPP